MKFALLGTDWQSLELAQASLTAGHEIVWCGDLTEESSATLAELFTSAPEDWGEQWESLCDQGACDGVIVGRGRANADLRAEQLNQLTKNGIALLTSFPIFDSVLTYYEIDMVRNESGAVLHHFNPLMEQRQVLEGVSGWLKDGHPDLGAVEQVIWHRPLASRSREEVLRHFARDVEFLDLISVRLNRLGALGSPDQQATYAGLSVQLLGRSNIPVRWEVGPVQQSAWPRLTLVAEAGSLTVEFNEAGQAMQLEINQGETSTSSPYEASDAALETVNRFVEVLDSGNSPRSSWSSALHAMELTDTIEISLRRGRMIDVHEQQLTEQMAFKGTMSALGCGVLMVLPPLLLLVGWLAELAGLPAAYYWPHGLLLLLVAFLGVQFLPMLLLPTGEESNPE